MSSINSNSSSISRQTSSSHENTAQTQKHDEAHNHQSSITNNSSRQSMCSEFEINRDFKVGIEVELGSSQDATSSSIIEEHYQSNINHHRSLQQYNSQTHADFDASNQEDLSSVSSLSSSEERNQDKSVTNQTNCKEENPQIIEVELTNLCANKPNLCADNACFQSNPNVRKLIFAQPLLKLKSEIMSVIQPTIQSWSQHLFQVQREQREFETNKEQIMKQFIVIIKAAGVQSLNFQPIHDSTNWQITTTQQVFEFSELMIQAIDSELSGMNGVEFLNDWAKAQKVHMSYCEKLQNHIIFPMVVLIDADRIRLQQIQQNEEFAGQFLPILKMFQNCNKNYQTQTSATSNN